MKISCLQRLADREGAYVCVHKFHIVCVLKWAMVRSTCPMCKAGFTQVKRSDDGEPINIRSTEDQEVDVPARRSSRLKRKRDEREDVMRGYVNGRIRSLVNRLEASTHLKRIAKWSSSVTTKNNINVVEQTNSDTKVKMKKKKTPQSQSAITTSQLLSENERLRQRLEKLKRKKRKKKKKRTTKNAIT